jgi:hypothetical protein
VPLQIFFERAPSSGAQRTPFMPSRFIQAPVGIKGATLYRQVNKMLLSLLEPRGKKAKHDAGADGGGNGGSGGMQMNDAADEDDDEPAELDADDEEARSSARAVLGSTDVSSLYELIWDYHHKFETKACDSPACSCRHHGICFGCALGADQVYATQRPSQQFRCRFTATAVALFARNKVRLLCLCMSPHFPHFLLACILNIERTRTMIASFCPPACRFGGPSTTSPSRRPPPLPPPRIVAACRPFACRRASISFSPPRCSRRRRSGTAARARSFGARARNSISGACRPS